MRGCTRTFSRKAFQWARLRTNSTPRDKNGDPAVRPMEASGGGLRAIHSNHPRHAASCGGLRVDHVLGLFRLFWVPQGLGPAKGTYVRYNADEMLAIVALESHRAQAFVAGEDLGTVEPGVSEKLQRNGILSYRVFWFEKEPPSTYPEMALASISTHDLPTIAACGPVRIWRCSGSSD